MYTTVLLKSLDIFYMLGHAFTYQVCIKLTELMVFSHF